MPFSFIKKGLKIVSSFVYFGSEEITLVEECTLKYDQCDHSKQPLDQQSMISACGHRFSKISVDELFRFQNLCDCPECEEPLSQGSLTADSESRQKINEFNQEKSNLLQQMKSYIPMSEQDFQQGLENLRVKRVKVDAYLQALAQEHQHTHQIQNAYNIIIKLELTVPAGYDGSKQKVELSKKKDNLLKQYYLIIKKNNSRDLQLLQLKTILHPQISGLYHNAHELQTTIEGHVKIEKQVHLERIAALIYDLQHHEPRIHKNQGVVRWATIQKFVNAKLPINANDTFTPSPALVKEIKSLRDTCKTRRFIQNAWFSRFFPPRSYRKLNDLAETCHKLVELSK